jgi:hypothetical protein
LQGQLALSASIADALKHNPSEADDLGLLMSGQQADLTPEAWCRATRFYRDALDRAPQPARDWAILAELDNQKRLSLALDASSAATRFASAHEFVQGRTRFHAVSI